MTSFLPFGTSMVNCPSISVMEPVLVPSTITDAPITGSPSSWEKTFPDTFVCATAMVTKRHSTDKSVPIRFSIKFFSDYNNLLETECKITKKKYNLQSFRINYQYY